jgi:hypothetical protein
MGLLAQQDAANNWEHPLMDGLGSVRSVLDSAAVPLYTAHYAPYGAPFDVTGSAQTPFGFPPIRYPRSRQQHEILGMCWTNHRKIAAVEGADVVDVEPLCQRS